MDAALPPGLVRIDFKNPTPFLIRTGEEIGRLKEYLSFIEDGHKPLLESFIPHFEQKAVVRLERVTKVLKKWHPVFKENPEAWRIWWLKEAYRTYVCEESIHQKIVDTACNILKNAAQLRAAMETGNPEKIATLAMLLVLEIIQGGNELERNSLDHQNYDYQIQNYEYQTQICDYQAKESVRKKVKTERIAKSIGKDAPANSAFKEKGISLAKETWEKCPEIRMTDMAKLLLKYFQENAEIFPTHTKYPEINTIKTWLKVACSEGALVIPEAAQKPGRAPKNNE